MAGETEAEGALAAAYRDLIVGVGEAPDREGLLRTPERAARALRYLTRGYGQRLEDVVNSALF